MIKVDVDRVIALEREDAARKAIELAAKRLESENVNEIYRAALRRGAKVVRGLLNSADFNEILKSNDAQIR